MCSCRKKINIGAPPTLPVFRSVETSPAEWGPSLWKLLHITAEHIGMSGKPIIDTDAGQHLQYIINNIGDVLPCPDCQKHAREYLFTNKFNAKDKFGEELQIYVRKYMFDFHNAVRGRTTQPTVVDTVDHCKTLYGSLVFDGGDTIKLNNIFKIAVAHRVIKGEKYTAWSVKMHKLRLLLNF